MKKQNYFLHGVVYTPFGEMKFVFIDDSSKKAEQKFFAEIKKMAKVFALDEYEVEYYVVIKNGKLAIPFKNFEIIKSDKDEMMFAA